MLPSRFREAQRQSCLFSPVEFHYLSKVDKQDELIEHFKKQSASDGNTEQTDPTFGENGFYGEKEKMGKLIIMDNASVLSDKFDAFVSFYNCHKKIQIQLCLYFSSDPPRKIYLKAYFVADKNMQYVSCLS